MLLAPARAAQSAARANRLRHRLKGTSVEPASGIAANDTLLLCREDGVTVQAPSLGNPVEPVTPAELVRRRRALGLSQRALGEMLGVPRNTVARWERGDVRISRPDWLELALARLESRNRRLSSARIDPSTLVVRATPQLPAELSNFVGMW